MKAIADNTESFHVLYNSGLPDLKWKGLNFVKFEVPSIPSELLRAYFARSGFVNQIKNLNPDIFYAISDGWQQEYMRYCAQKLGKPLVIRVRGDYKKIEDVSKKSVIKKNILGYIRKKSYKKSDLIIPISKQNRNDIISWGYLNKEKITQPIPNGIDTNLFKPNKNKNHEFTVGFIGRISPEKGIEVLIETIKESMDIKFIIVGRTQMKVKFPENCKYLGRYPHEEIPNVYNNIDLVILPSITEGMPNTILESYACNTPILTHKNVFPNELPIFGIVQNKNDPHEYSESIKKIKNREYNIIDAHAYIKSNHNWDVFGKQMYKILSYKLK